MVAGDVTAKVRVPQRDGVMNTAALSCTARDPIKISRETWMTNSILLSQVVATTVLELRGR
jgi:hypothetical protein